MDPLRQRIVSSYELRKNPAIFGNKTTGLVRLKKYGFKVPGFYAVSADLVQQRRSSDTIGNLVDDWIRRYDLESDTLWAVRSSTQLEDSDKQAYAGLFHTELNVVPADIPGALFKVLESYPSSEGGIIIQEQIKADFSGVVFSKDPLNPGSDKIIIKLTSGTGEKLVSGELTGETVYFANNQFDFTAVNGQAKIPDKDLLKELISGVKKLERKTGKPLDVEFCIKNNILYWLQVRPITTFEHQKSYTWDNANIGDNFPGISLPLTISYVKHTYATAYKGLAIFLGMSQQQIKQNTELFESMVGGVNGHMYYNVTAWQELLKQLPFRNITTMRLVKTWNMKEIDMQGESYNISPMSYLRLLYNLFISLMLFNRKEKAFQKMFRAVYDQYNKIDYNECEPHELIDYFHGLEEQLTKNWIIPVLNGLLLMLYFGRLNKLLDKANITTKHPGFLNDVIVGYKDVKSAQLIHDYFALIRKIQNNPSVKEAFQTKTNKTLFTDLPEIDKECFQHIQHFIEEYGERCEGGELKIEKINYKEDPLRFVQKIRENLDLKIPDLSNSDNRTEYHRILREAYPFNFLQRRHIRYLINRTSKLMSNREEHRFLRLKAYHIIRRIFRAMDAQAYASNRVVNQNDTQFLHFDELLDMSKSGSYKAIIRERKAQYKAFQNIKVHRRYIQEGSTFVPDISNIENSESDIIKGLGCCRGLVEAEVVIYEYLKVNDTDLSDKIVLAKFIEPVNLTSISKAAGIILERGNLLSHTAILCRELGIPSIVGAKNARDQLSNGDRIIMNGANGQILKTNGK